MSTMPTIRRSALAAIAFLGATSGGTGPVAAVVRYELNYQTFSMTIPEVFRNQFPTNPLPLSFTVSDAAVRRGSINVRGSGDPSRTIVLYSGDSADFISLDVRSDIQTPQTTIGRFALNVSFAPDISVSNFFLDYLGRNDETILSSIDRNVVSGFFGSDTFQVCSFRASNCSVSGRIEVFEPASIGLIATGLLWTVSTRTRRRHRAEWSQM